MNNILSISGGKDSTAMLLEMLRRGEKIHSAVFFDTGWEFPQMYEHLDRLEAYAGVKIVRLYPPKGKEFDHLLISSPRKYRGGERAGEHRGYGYGWPSFRIRWCTNYKVKAIDKYAETIGDSCQLIGFTTDEIKRTKKPGVLKKRVRFPLIEWGMSEKDALAYCLKRGFSWGGLYDHFDRVSCFCCPFNRLAELRAIRTHYPDLWRRLLEMDRAISDNRGFNGYATVVDLDKRFSEEDRQMKLWA